MFLKVLVQFLILIVATSGRNVRFALNEDRSLQVYTVVYNKVAYSQKACIFRGNFFLYPCNSYDRPRLRLLKSEELFQDVYKLQDLYMTLPPIRMGGLIPVKANCIVGATPVCNLSNTQMFPRNRSGKGKLKQKGIGRMSAESNGREDQDDSDQMKMTDDVESKDGDEEGEEEEEEETPTEEKQPVPESQDISSPASEETESNPDKDDGPVI